MSHSSRSSPEATEFDVKLLELNAEPAIELTGDRLTWILEDLYKGIAHVCIEPFFNPASDILQDWKIGQVKHGLRKCLEVPMQL